MVLCRLAVGGGVIRLAVAYEDRPVQLRGKRELAGAFAGLARAFAYPIAGDGKERLPCDGRVLSGHECRGEEHARQQSNHFCTVSRTVGRTLEFPRCRNSL